MSYTIKFNRNEYGHNIDPLMEQIRQAARSEGWSRIEGFKCWAKEHYHATLRTGLYDDWTSINFKTEAALNKFKKDFGVIDDAACYAE